MQTVNQKFIDAIEKNVDISVFGRVEAEWEINSYYDYEFTIDDSVDDVLFPADFVTRPRRPRAGLPKLVARQSNGASGRVTDEENPLRFRTASTDSEYKYYSSEATADSTGAIAFSAQIDYPEKVNVNRLVVGFENAYSQPQFVRVFFQYNENDGYQDIGSYTPNGHGLVNIHYYNGQWTDQDVFPDSFEQPIGVRIEVEQMQNPFSKVDLIQISPRLAFDFTDRTVFASVDSSRGERSIANPLGIAQSSSFKADFSNEDRFFSPENPDSPVFRLIDRNVRVDFWTLLDVRERVARPVDPEFAELKQITAFVDSWSFSAESLVSIEARDRSKFLQERMIENSFYKDKEARFIVRDILERAEILNYDIRYADDDTAIVIPYVFFDDSESVWRCLQELAVAEQASFYFDENDVFVWESRDYIWGKDSEQIEVRSQRDEDKFANLIEFDFDYTVGVNKATVEWANTDKPRSGGEPVNNVLWELNEDTVLGATPLLSDIDSESETFFVSEDDARFFPDEGIVSIDAEYLSYEKGELDGDKREMKIVERGKFLSSPRDHNLRPEPSGWEFYTYSHTNVVFPGMSPQGRYFVKDSLATIVKPETVFRSVSHFETGSETDSYSVYGCRIKFPLRNLEDEIPNYEGDGAGGLYIHRTAKNTGYYFEVITTPFAFRSEISQREARIWKFDSNGQIEVLRGFYPDIETIETAEDYIKYAGADIVVSPGLDYDLTVHIRPGTFLIDGQEVSSNEIRFLVNGQTVLSLIDDEFVAGKWGVFARSKTVAEFEYAFAIDEKSTENDLPTYIQKTRNFVSGGFKSNILSEFLNQDLQKSNDIILEDFGPWVQEVREFDIDHELFPAITTDLFISRGDEVGKVYRDRDQFSTRFALANRSRRFSVISGSDPFTGTSSKVFIYGIPVIRKEVNAYKVSDQKSIWRRGTEELSIESDFVQTEEHAKRIGDWLVSRWGKSSDFISVTIMMNPAIQIGDIVALSIPEESIFPETHQYFVAEKSLSVGSTTSMELELARIYR